MEDKMDFKDLLDELTENELTKEEIPAEDGRFETVTDDNVNDFVLEYGSKLVKDGMNAIEIVKPKITSGQNADEISALSEMIRAMNSTLDTLTKISLQNKKEKSAKDQRELSHTQRKELGNSTINTQVIISTREDAFKQMIENAEKVVEAIDIPEESDNESD